MPAQHRRLRGRAAHSTGGSRSDAPRNSVASSDTVAGLTSGLTDDELIMFLVLIVVAGNEPLSRTGAEATVIASVALSLALTAAGALALSRNRGDAAAAQALSDSTRPTSAR